MGKHTAYWHEYSRAQVRGTVRLFMAIAAWVLLVAMLAMSHEFVGRIFPWLMGAAFLGLVLTVFHIGRNAYRVVCPECGTHYTRSKWGGTCPACGLGLLQQDP